MYARVFGRDAGRRADSPTALLPYCRTPLKGGGARDPRRVVPK
jgi:hypothetical protein